MRALGVMVVAALLSACGGRAAHPDQDAEAKRFQAAAGQACVYVLPSPRVSEVTVFMDGRKIGTLGAGDYFRLDVAPGPHVLYVTRPTPLPAFLRDASDDLTIDVERDRCYFLGTAWRDVDKVVQEYRLYLERLPEDEGRRHVNVRWLLSPAK